MIINDRIIVVISVNVNVFPAWDDSAVLCYLEKKALLYVGVSVSA